MITAEMQEDTQYVKHLAKDSNKDGLYPNTRRKAWIIDEEA